MRGKRGRVRKNLCHPLIHLIFNFGLPENKIYNFPIHSTQGEGILYLAPILHQSGNT